MNGGRSCGPHCIEEGSAYRGLGLNPEEIGHPDESADHSGDRPREHGHPHDKSAFELAVGKRAYVPALKMSSRSVGESLSQLTAAVRRVAGLGSETLRQAARHLPAGIPIARGVGFIQSTPPWSSVQTCEIRLAP